MDRADIKQVLFATLSDFIADWGLDTDLEDNTTLVEDLEFDSIDVIQFTVALESAFGKRKLGFQDLLMQDGRYIDDLTVAEIEVFLSSKLAA